MTTTGQWHAGELHLEIQFTRFVIEVIILVQETLTVHLADNNWMLLDLCGMSKNCDFRSLVLLSSSLVRLSNLITKRNLNQLTLGF